MACKKKQGFGELDNTPVVGWRCNGDLTGVTCLQTTFHWIITHSNYRMLRMVQQNMENPSFQVHDILRPIILI